MSVSGDFTELGRPTGRPVPTTSAWTSASLGRFFFCSFRSGLLASSSRAEWEDAKEKMLETLASLSEELDQGNLDILLLFFFFLESGLSASEVSGSVKSVELV